MVEVLLKICNLNLKTGLWPSELTESNLIPLPKKGNSKKCTNYRAIGLISHASKVMLKIIQKRLTPQVAVLLSETQAGFRKLEDNQGGVQEQRKATVPYFHRFQEGF